MIDYTITVGNITEIAAFLMGGGAALVTLRTKVISLADDMADMKEEIKKVGDVLVRMAVTSTRLDNVEQDIRDMKHGRGFIQSGRDALNGEYP